MFRRGQLYNVTGVLVALGSLASGGLGAAHAQEIEEIYVTAQKREQRLVDVPVAITALTADEINRRALTSAADYLRGVPSVNQVGDTNGVAGQSIVIRGLETTTGAQNYYAGATVGTYFGETPTTSSQGLLGANVDIKLVDIERVEVLRGPQGTSFGSSSVGGTVRVIPSAPNVDEFKASAMFNGSTTEGYGGENYKVEGMVNVPLVDGRVAVRAVAYKHSDSGYYRNIAATDPAFNAAIAPFNIPREHVTNEKRMGDYEAEGVRIAFAVQATDELKFTGTYVNQTSSTVGSPLQNVGYFTQVMLRPPIEHQSKGRTAAWWDANIEIWNATVEYDAGWGDIIGTYSRTDGGGDTSYTVFGPFFPLALGARPISYLANMDHTSDSGELRVVSKFDGPLNFLAGVYAESMDDSYVIPSTIWYGSAASNPYGTLRNTGTQLLTYDLKQKAAFGEATWAFSDQWELTAGARVFDFERNDRSAGTGVFWGFYDVNGATEESDAIFRANLSYKPDDDSMIYGGWSQGFRLGRAQGLSPPNCDANNDGRVDGLTVTFNDAKQITSDTVDSYEVGGKVSAFGNRLFVNAAAFYMDWKNIPVNTRPVATCPLTLNAGAAQSKGLELQMRFQATDSLAIDLGASYVKARLDGAVPLAGFLDNARLPAPEYNANLGVQQDFEVMGREAFVRLDGMYIGDFYGNLNMTPNTFVKDYVKFDLRGRVTVDNVKFDLYINNLMDEDAFTSRSHYTFGGTEYGYRLRPRTFGAQVLVNY